MKNALVYKYTLAPETVIELPQFAEVLSAKEQYGEIVLYVLLDPSEDAIKRKFIAVPTGVTFDASNLYFIDTVMLRALVFHIFEFIPDEDEPV